MIPLSIRLKMRNDTANVVQNKHTFHVE